MDYTHRSYQEGIIKCALCRIIRCDIVLTQCLSRPQLPKPSLSRHLVEASIRAMVSRPIVRVVLAKARRTSKCILVAGVSAASLGLWSLRKSVWASPERVVSAHVALWTFSRALLALLLAMVNLNVGAASRTVVGDGGGMQALGVRGICG